MMRLVGTWLLAATVANAVVVAQAQVRLLPDAPQAVFAGGRRMLELRWRNLGAETASMNLHARVFQSSATTAVLVSKQPWKPVHVLPRQTVLESAALDFPAVRAPTTFFVQWLVESNLVGITQVRVYPTNLLNEFEPLLGGASLGVLDPNGLIKPSLKQAGMGFLDLSEMVLENFSGKLAIVGPFQSREQMRPGLAPALRHLARAGVAVIWIQPWPGPDDQLRPSFYNVAEGKGVVVVVQPELVADFATNPQSQLNLIYLCKWALNPVPLQIPDLTAQP